MESNKRKIFFNTKVLCHFLAYVVFTVLVVATFFFWSQLVEMFPILESTSAKSSSGLSLGVKIILLLLWGVVSFQFCYAYLDSKFLGIFLRMDRVFTEMQTNESTELKFRQDDPFDDLAQAFNKMKEMFLGRIAKRKDLIEKASEEVKGFDENTDEEQVKALLEKINQELSSN